MNVRKNVYQLPAGDSTLEWYSKAVVAMKNRKTTDPTSWNYQAAMHGFNVSSPFWRGAAPLPSQAEQNQYWNRCQHSSWFFLPWHRMYLAYFEQIVAQTIIGLGGPQDWALPFWDYSDSSNPNARTIPGAFTNPGNAANNLWITGRKSSTVAERSVLLTSLDTIPFTGDGRTAPLGFGGPETPFNHGGGYPFGKLESLPHNPIHVDIGGAMGVPSTAGFGSPIFWLHHANIDRLWQVWLNKGNRRANPPQSSWLNFKFDFHDKNGNGVQMKCSDVEDTRKVLSGYTYQGVPPGVPALQNVASFKAADFSMPLEVAAATNKKLALGAAKTTVHLSLLSSLHTKANFAAAAKGPAKPPMEMLHFENITGKGVPPTQDIYLNVPKDDGNKEQYYAGSISFFGLEEASTPSVHQPGSGLHYVLDVSELVNNLRNLPNWNAQQLDVSIEPTEEMDKGASVTIGRISLYSE